MRRTIPLAALCASALLTLAACGSSSDPSTTAGTTTSSATINGPGGNAGAAMDPTLQAPAPPIPGATKGGRP